MATQSTQSTQYRCASLMRHQGKKGTAARTRRRTRRELSRLHQCSILREMELNNLLFNERLLVAQGLQEVSKAFVTKYKLLGYLTCIPSPSPSGEVEVEAKEAKVETLIAGLACTTLTTLLVGVMAVIHLGTPEIRCNMIPREARGYDNPVSVCYNLK